ncbi:hypothetical protein Tco_1005214 [Tanacetum coccineum]|uniref:Uncharacterized protein n=1 Tax=Tanacetum coccineum TaxID=301880 RepID=A0ABQ5FE20_9ASTR
MHQLQQMQDKAKEKCMESFRLLHSHLKTFTESLLLNLDNLEKQLDREEFQETESIGAVKIIRKTVSTSSRSGKDTHAEDADINSVNDKQPLAEVQLTVQHDTPN